MDKDLAGLLSKLSHILTPKQRPAYVVGGFVRDWFLGRQTVDVDIAVKGDALKAARQMAQSVNGKYVMLDDVNKVGRVVVGIEPQWHLDFASFQKDIEADLARRDFTINAMAFELESVIAGSLKLIDPLSGKEDLKKKSIQAVSNQIFQADAARLMRAVRMSAELNFKIAAETELLIKRNCRLAATVPGERIREELVRAIALPGAAALVRYMDSLGLLTTIIPELESLKGVEQPKEHYWDVFNHSVETVATAEFLLRQGNWRYGKKSWLSGTPWTEDVKRHFEEEVSSGTDRKTMLKIGALLHDIAKPATKAVDETGRTRFLGHPKDGAAIAAKVLERLRFSSKEIRLIENLVYHHLRPAQMSNEGLPTSRAIYRFFRDTEGAGIDILILALADYLATHGPELDIQEWKHHNHVITFVLNEHLHQETKVLPVKLVDGNDLIDIFGLKPGRLLGELLKEVKEAQAAEELTTREQALDLVRKELKKSGAVHHAEI